MKVGLVYRIGVDAGSTTLKIIVLDNENAIVYSAYRRHNADISPALTEELRKVEARFPAVKFAINITGSAGMGIAERTGIPFVQEVVASIEVVNKMHPETRMMIDLGGEDAKMVFFHSGRQPDIRMNGSCAGGTGAFIDQMADLMNISVGQLGGYAAEYEKIYPVASRCGVFAKTDVQNLISRNIPVPDLSKSILHTVALQSITALARGADIKPKVLFIGGPLTFIPPLRESFRELLELGEDDVILPENGEFFPALGCALLAKSESVELAAVIERLGKAARHSEKDVLPALFKDEAAYAEWLGKRKIKKLKTRPLGTDSEIECFLGIDSGSTTTKILIMDAGANIVYKFYAGNQGNPLKKVTEGLEEFYRQAWEKGVSYRFISSAATGYGEDLVKSALGLDYGIVETMAHLSGAQYVDPDVSFVLDIGGQDMKSIFTESGLISNIELNEACSSGCGSFLQNFASAMNLSLPDFTRAAALASYPSDLGSRCTVFMNSKVKQSLRENARPGDIAAGLAYSVVKNCLFKVLKISNLNRLGDNIVVQGGTFRNDAVYRALELLSGKSVSSTDHPELMGAFGAALYARKMWNKNKGETSFTGAEPLPDAGKIESRELQCGGCTNKCSVLRFKFANGNISYAGNKCEKVFFNKNTAGKKGCNAFDMKNGLLFKDALLVNEKTFSGKTIGIPRVLNMFENYPFWNKLLTECGFNVVLSPESTFPLYQKGVGNVTSENICFPAKLVHGHVLALMEQKVDRIFYPMVSKEDREFGCSSNSYNCPIVSGFPDVVRSALDPEGRYGVPLDKPVITFSDDNTLRRNCFDYLSSLGVSKNVFDRAFKDALVERRRIREALRDSQKKFLDEAVKNGELVFVVAGRPYHSDPLIHQKVGQILSDLGGHVLTDDVFRIPESGGFAGLKLVSQWSYPNRTVQAAMETAKLPQNVQLIQLNSFGCGPDSFFMDEIGELLRQAGKNHTILRIDEISSPGSVRLRLRSLIESLKASAADKNEIKPYEGYARTYTEEDRRKTILAPWFTDFVSPFVPAIAELAGYKLVNLPRSSKQSAETGLKYGHNEVCYPSTLVLGDIILGLQSGKYDLGNTVVAITQTGGQCRATNYVSQIKSGLANAGFACIPVVIFSAGEVYQNEQKAFRLPVRKIMNIAVYTLLYADALQQMFGASVVREKYVGDTQKVFDRCVERGIRAVRNNSGSELLNALEIAVEEFNAIEIHSRELTKIGLIGEIYVKYNNYGQAHISEWLRSRGVEVETPPLLDFFTQYFVNSDTNHKNGLKKRSLTNKLLSPLIWKYLNARVGKVEKIMCRYRHYQASESIYAKARYASEIIDLSNQFGEGWAIAGEIAAFARAGINRVVCIQPFGCIANHVVAKGIERRIKKFYPEMNILYLDIDGGMAEVNLQNRLHFLMT